MVNVVHDVDQSVGVDCALISVYPLRNKKRVSESVVFSCHRVRTFVQVSRLFTHKPIIMSNPAPREYVINPDT